MNSPEFISFVSGGVVYTEYADSATSLSPNLLARYQRALAGINKAIEELTKPPMPSRHKTKIADALKRTARALIKLANKIDGPAVTYYDDQWKKISDA